MHRISYYILCWYDEGDTNRSEVVWRGKNLKDAEEYFNFIKFTGNLFVVELWETGSDYDEDIRLDYKFA